MKFLTSRFELVKALQRVAGVVDRRGVMAILGNILIQATKEKGVVISATDLSVAMVGPCDHAEIEQDGSVLVAAKSFLDVIKNMPAEGVAVKVDPDNFRITVKCGKVEFKLIGTNPSDYPKIARAEDMGAEFFTMEHKLLSDMIDKTLFSVSTDETRFHLNGVFFTASGNKLRLVSTDGHRLSVAERQVEGIEAFRGGVIVPRKGLLEINKMIHGKESTVQMALKGSNIYLREGDVTLTVKLIDAQFPDYEQVIPKNSANVATLNRESFMASLKRISLLSSSQAHGVKISLKKGVVRVAGDNQDFGEGHEDLDATYDGADLTVGFNAHYILDVLGAIASKAVLLRVNDEISPGLIEPVSDDLNVADGYRAIIMPMRI